MYVYNKILLNHVFKYEITMYIIILIEFHTNGHWGYSIPVHRGLSLHTLQPNSYHVKMCNLHTTSKLYELYTSPYVCYYIIQVVWMSILKQLVL